MQFCKLLGVCLVAAAPLAATPRARAENHIAVLEFRGKSIAPEVLAMLSDEARQGVLDALVASGRQGDTIVMTREAMLATVKDMGQNAVCAEGECEVETARNIGADWVVSGEVATLDGAFILTLKIHDTKRAALLNTARAEAPTLRRLINEAHVRRAGAALVALLFPGGSRATATAAPAPIPSAPTIRSGQVTQAFGDLTVAGKPKDGIRFEFTDPQGRAFASGSPYRNERAAVGRWTVVASASGHVAATREFEVPPDEPSLIKIELEVVGSLRVIGSPQGAAVKVDGPDGFKHVGGLPWEASGLRPGTYRVVVERDGYASSSHAVQVDPGAAAEVRVDLRKDATGRVAVRDSRGPERLSMSQIMGVVHGQRPAIKACVDEQKAREPETAGTLVMRWTIRPDGTTAAIQTRSAEYQEAPIAACLAAQIHEWVFPAYSGEQMPPVDIPITF